MRILLLVLPLLLPFSVSSAKVVYETDSMAVADQVIYVTKNLSEADVVVYQTTSITEAKSNPNHWYWTPNASEADVKVYISTQLAGADLVVFFRNKTG